MKSLQPIWLASSSPRRHSLLQEAGVSAKVHPPDLDDAALEPAGAPPARWVCALAYLKARRVADALLARDSGATGTVLGADTVCVADGRILGQPRDRAHAREMLHALRNRMHHTLTGAALIRLPGGERHMLVDRAAVTIGQLSDEAIEQYLASGDWTGKAGAYNLAERLDAGWPIECRGDPATVMGLPMIKLKGILESGF
jgi:septum formation protein